MSVDAVEPEEPEDQDEHLADDDTQAEAVPVERKRGRIPLTPTESAKLSEQMWEEYFGGLTTQQIADLHGVHRRAVWRRIAKYRQEHIAEDEPAKAKAVNLGRIEALIERSWRRVNEDPSLENIKAMAMLMEMQARILGYNAAKRLNVEGEIKHSPAPELVGMLERITHDRSPLSAQVDRPEIEAPDAEVVEAELVDPD